MFDRGQGCRELSSLTFEYARCSRDPLLLIALVLPTENLTLHLKHILLCAWSHTAAESKHIANGSQQTDLFGPADSPVTVRNFHLGWGAQR